MESFYWFMLRPVMNSFYELMIWAAELFLLAVTIHGKILLDDE
jgi:hypothetical protein